jgi:hypothetical protein
MNELDPLLQDYLVARRARDDAQMRMDDAQALLMKQMEADQRKSYKWTADGMSHSVSYTQGHVTLIDEKGLRRALTAKVFDRYTKKVLDRKAMESAMDAGQVDPITVSRFVTLRPNHPHLSLVEKEVRE